MLETLSSYRGNSKPVKLKDQIREAVEDQPDTQEVRREARPVRQHPQGKEPQTIKDLPSDRSLAMQFQEQHGQRVPLRFFECGQEIGAAREHQGSSIIQHVEEVDGGWQHTTEDHHQRGEALVHSLKQSIEGQRHENHDAPDEQVADNAETEERLMRGDVVGRRARVALHEQLAGNVEDADRAGDGEEQVQESGDSPGVAGRAHVPSLTGVLSEVRRRRSKCFVARAKGGSCDAPGTRVAILRNRL